MAARTLALLAFAAAALFADGITTDGVLRLANRERARAGVPALRHSIPLARAAQAKANDMASRGYFSHDTPDGRTPWDFIRAEGYRYSSAAENLAAGQRTIDALERGWLRSAPHRANIRNRAFSETGVGVASGPDGPVIVQLFAAPAR